MEILPILLVGVPVGFLIRWYLKSLFISVLGCLLALVLMTSVISDVKSLVGTFLAELVGILLAEVIQTPKPKKR